MSKNYYCLVAGLPDMRLGEMSKNLPTVDSLRAELQEELTAEDSDLVDMLFLPSEDRTKAMLASGNDFLKQYAQYDITLRNILVALQGRKYGRDVTDEFVGNDDVVEQLCKSRLQDFGLKGDIEQMDEILAMFETSNLVEREMKLDALRWNYIEDATFFNYFGVEKLIVALLKLSMVQRWAQLDEEGGRLRFEKIIKEIRELANSKID
jgi:hypothetical protein